MAMLLMLRVVLVVELGMPAGMVMGCESVMVNRVSLVDSPIPVA